MEAQDAIDLNFIGGDFFIFAILISWDHSHCLEEQVYFSSSGLCVKVDRSNYLPYQ